ncbi:unnamed protein product [Mucor hiemalis]
MIVRPHKNSSPSSTIFYYNRDGANKSIYTFNITPSALASAGVCIENSRKTIPVSFQGSWDNLISKTDGARAIDFIDFLLFVVPTLLVPLFDDVKVRNALLNLVKGCAIALQWNLTESLLTVMENCFEKWHSFLEKEIESKRLSAAVFRPNNHYLSHIAFITRNMGNLRAYTTRSMERTIGRYSRLITSRVHSGKHAGNLFERHAIRGFLQFSLDVQDLLDLVKPNKTSLDDYIQLSDSSLFDLGHQLWSPFREGALLTRDSFVSRHTFLEALNKYYKRSNYTPAKVLDDSNLDVTIAARAWLNNYVYFGSELYRKLKNEGRRGNHYLWFNASVKNRQIWFIGAVMF